MRSCLALFALAAVACADEVVRVELPPAAASLRVLVLGDGSAAPRTAWVVGVGEDANLPLVELRGTIELIVLDYDAPALPPGEYVVAAPGEPAERLVGAVATLRSTVTTEGDVSWSTLTIAPAGVATLDLRVPCPPDSGDPARLPRHCPLDTSKRVEVCYGAPVFSPSLSAVPTASAAAEFVDEALETVTESDGSRWIYGMSSRLAGPGIRQTLPARWRLASSVAAVEGSYERLPLVDEPVEALRGYAQGLRVRSDGLEIFFVSSFPDAGKARVAHAWRSELGEAWSPSRVRLVPSPNVQPPSTAEVAPLLLPDFRTLLYRSGSIIGASVLATRRAGTTPGDGPFPRTFEPVVIDGSEGTVGVISASLSCDGRHLLYTRLYMEAGVRLGEARVVPIRSLDPLELGQPQVVPIEGGPLDDTTTLGEAPDCSAIYVSGKILRVAPRVSCT